MSPADHRAAPKSGRRAFRRVALATLAALFVGAGVIAVQVAPYLSDGDEYAAVASIEGLPTYRDPALMEKASALPAAASYGRPLIYQANPSFCGPTSIANVLRSLGVERTPKEVLDRSEVKPVFGLLIGGLTLDEEAELLRLNATGRVEILRDLTLKAFRAEMMQVNDPNRRYVVNFHRGPMFGRGHGHFSPLLAYLPDEDLALVGDVNADYRPYLVSVDRLWKATDTVDSETGLERGLIVIESAARE